MLPNPVKDQLIFDHKMEETSDVKISIVNLSGQLVTFKHFDMIKN